MRTDFLSATLFALSVIGLIGCIVIVAVFRYILPVYRKGRAEQGLGTKAGMQELAEPGERAARTRRGQEAEHYSRE